MSKRTREVGDSEAKKQSKMRFKKLVRGVILNMQWLSESNEYTAISLNVKKNVAMLVRQKRKVGMLTMAEKSLLRSTHSQRTVEERKKLCTIVGNLSCFSKLPPKIRARLIPHITFMAFNAGRVIMKEGDKPITLYFIVTGEIEMSKKYLNKINDKYEVKVEALFGPGDCIGDVDVMEEEPRSNTYTARTACELLLIYEPDYKVLLKPYLKKLWLEKKAALQALDYFNFFSDDQIVNACKYGSIQQFDPLETIYAEDGGVMSFVYFVLSGECVLLQCLHMKVTQNDNEKVFELTSISKKAAVSDILDEEGKKRMRMAVKKESSFDANEYLQSSSSLDEQGQSKKKALRKMDLQEIERACHLWMRPPESRKQKSQSIGGISPSYVEPEDDLFSDDADDYADTKKHPIPTASSIEAESEGSEVFTAATSTSSTQTTVSAGAQAQVPVPDKYETHFIDVGSLSYGGIFGLGEKMDHRVIMARTTVQCLVLPRFWLLEKPQNLGNVWYRERFYINCNIPSREALFQDFLKTRKWEKFRHEYIQSFLDPDSLGNSTKVEDIPIISRIVEKTED